MREKHVFGWSTSEMALVRLGGSLVDGLVSIANAYYVVRRTGGYMSWSGVPQPLGNALMDVQSDFVRKPTYGMSC